MKWTVILIRSVDLQDHERQNSLPMYSEYLLHRLEDDRLLNASTARDEAREIQAQIDRRAVESGQLVLKCTPEPDSHHYPLISAQPGWIPFKRIVE